MSRRIFGMWSALVASTALGCGDPAFGPPTYSVTDSAGVRIVLNERPIWGPDEGWSLSPDPALELGVAQGDDALQFAGIEGVTRLSDGRIVVLDRGSSQLRFFGSEGVFDVFEEGNGRVMSIRYPGGLPPLTEEHVSAYDAYLEELSASVPAGVRMSLPTEFASTRPGFGGLHHDPNGYLWAVEYATPWEVVEGALVFSRDGQLLGQVALPAGFAIEEIGSDYVLGVFRDDVGVEFVRVYELYRVPLPAPEAGR